VENAQTIGAVELSSTAYSHATLSRIYFYLRGFQNLELYVSGTSAPGLQLMPAKRGIATQRGIISFFLFELQLMPAKRGIATLYPSLDSLPTVFVAANAC